MKSTTLLTTAALAFGVDAFWRMECHGRSGLARIDPLISPGEISTHVHSIHGSGGFSESATYDDLMSSNCTSCAVEQDKSAYWHPSLYFQDATTGKFEVVGQTGGMLAYYLLYTNTGETKVTAFPKGFRMIAGDTTRRNYSTALGDVSQPDPEKSHWASLGQTTQEDLQQRALGFNCLNYAKAAEGSLYRHFLPDKDYLDANCADGVRFELMFPSCWNGKDLDSTNHRDHVAYPDLVMTGTCPSSHPTRLISLFYETIWDTYAFKNRAGKFVIANGDPTGFGYHGDFMMGWDEDFLQQAANTCTSGTGRIEDCPLFTIQDDSAATQCKIKTPIGLQSEGVTGPGLDTLPGNVAIQAGPAPAFDGATSSVPATSTGPAPVLSYQPGSTATGETYLPGQVFKVTSSEAAFAAAAEETYAAIDQAAPAAVETSTPLPTPETTTSPTTPTPPPTTPTPSSSEPLETFDAVSTQYITAGNVVEEIVWAEEIVYVTEFEDEVETVTVTASEAVYQRARRNMRRHRHQARHHH